MKLLLIRHGQSQCNVLKQVTGSAESPLSALGCSQVSRLKETLCARDLSSTEVWVSAMRRARETAEILFPNIAHVVDPAYNEVDAGKVAEWPRGRFDEVFDDFWCPFDPKRQFPDGESHQDLQDRVIAALTLLIDRKTGSDELIVLVAHAGTISSIFHWLYAVPMESFSRFVVDNASATLLEWEGGSDSMPHLRFFNLLPQK